MAVRRRLALLALLPPSGCGPLSSQSDLPVAGSRLNCGFGHAYGLFRERMRTRPGDDSTLMRARACNLLDTEAIDIACTARDSMTYQDPGESDARHTIPDYRVRDARCVFTGRGRSDATCTFELLEPAESAAWRTVRMHFTYWFVLGSDEAGHAAPATLWSPAGSCRADADPASD